MSPRENFEEDTDTSGMPSVNDPGNEDPGSVTDGDATVPLIDPDDEAGDE